MPVLQRFGNSGKKEIPFPPSGQVTPAESGAGSPLNYFRPLSIPGKLMRLCREGSQWRGPLPPQEGTGS
jgi:hypothetical protein